MKTDDIVKQSLELAKDIQTRAMERGGSSAFSKRLKPLLKYPAAKSFLIHLLDVAFRSDSYAVIAKFVKKLLGSSHDHWVLFSGMEQKLIGIFQVVGHRFPSVSIPFMRDKIADVSKNVVFVHGSVEFEKHAERRKSEGIALNINLIGEALMGEEEAYERVEQYCRLLNEPSVDYISVKISTIYSQIESMAYEETLVVLKQRLTTLYQELLDIHENTGRWKFINLDMEEYRDLSLTVDTFISTLSMPAFQQLRAGIVLQAYIPDSYRYLIKLQEWARQRVEDGGAPIKIRVVKGANMEMEKTEASTQGWPLVTYEHKIDSDANYKKMLLQLLQAGSCESIHVGIASHNVFDLAFAICLVKEHGLQSKVDFEMLEGMAGNLSTEILAQGVNVLLYTPLVDKSNFMSAIAYLVRRLDEGTADGNFLKEGFELTPQSAKWKELEAAFLASVARINEVSDQPKRKQDRGHEDLSLQQGFANEPDTDWVLAQNRAWLKQIVGKWQHTSTVNGASYIPVSGTAKDRKKIQQENWQGAIPWAYELADVADYQDAISKGKASAWIRLSAAERIAVLREAAVELRKNRGDLIGVGIAEVGKLVKELDPEVSEAIDFANYYAYAMEQLTAIPDLDFEQGGINLVLSPWNFPIAIPAGGVLASLVSGNAVILKPSLNAAACAYLMCECLWNAGVPRDALFFLPAEESVLDSFLAKGKVFDAVILTGGTDTAKMLLDRNPQLNLFAETGGKNATIITALADREQAIKHVIHSAFGNAGQKCSATSLLILEREIYEDGNFKKLLYDALQSKKVGSPWEMDTQIGPLCVAPNHKLQALMKNTSPEQWLLRPQVNRYMMQPGVLWSVKQGDEAYREELFGPVLGVMCAHNLQEAIELVNHLEYGLTSGLESLDEDEIELWKNNIQAGNLYVNRSTTGAIVQRQPFGGIKSSCFGFGMKAGGINYLTQFLHPVNTSTTIHATLGESMRSLLAQLDDSSILDLVHAQKDYAKCYESFFALETDEAHVRGQYNLNRYLKPNKVILTVDEQVSLRDIMLVYTACKVLEVPLEVKGLQILKTHELLAQMGITYTVIDSWDILEPSFKYGTVVRALNKSRLPDALLKKANAKAFHLYGEKPLSSGRFELLNYLTEQSISYSFHRYGNLMGKEA